MNNYGYLARTWWENHAPNRLASLDDPTTYFTDLGESIAGQVAQIEKHLLRNREPVKGYLEDVGTRRMIRKQAEEVVLSDLVWSVTEPSSDLREQLDEMLWDLPSPLMVDDIIDQDKARREDEAEMRGKPVLMTLEEEHQLAYLEGMKKAVTLTTPLEEMSQEQLEQKIAEVTPYLEQQP